MFKNNYIKIFILFIIITILIIYFIRANTYEGFIDFRIPMQVFINVKTFGTNPKIVTKNVYSQKELMKKTYDYLTNDDFYHGQFSICQMYISNKKYFSFFNYDYTVLFSDSPNYGKQIELTNFNNVNIINVAFLDNVDNYIDITKNSSNTTIFNSIINSNYTITDNHDVYFKIDYLYNSSEYYSIYKFIYGKKNNINKIINYQTTQTPGWSVFFGKPKSINSSRNRITTQNDVSATDKNGAYYHGYFLCIINYNNTDLSKLTTIPNPTLTTIPNPTLTTIPNINQNQNQNQNQRHDRPEILMTRIFDHERDRRRHSINRLHNEGKH